jgi:carbonic anhydrase
MTTRRHFLGATAVLTAGALSARAQDVCTPFTKADQSATTPQQALQRLQDGNARFAAGRTIHCDPRALIKATAPGQAPFAAVLGCMDSRAPPELVFDQKIGDIFAVRIAGNFVNPDILGSLEYATQVAGAKLIVVLGHSDCGAVKGAIDGVKLGNLTAALANIHPAVEKVESRGGAYGARTSKDKKFLQAVADQNVHDATAMLTARSPLLAQLVAANKLKIVPAMHAVDSGVVTWLPAGTANS